MLEELRQDRESYEPLGGWSRSLGFWVGATYRLGVWAHGLRPAVLRIFIVALYRIAKIPWRLFLNVSISPGASIGPGLRLIHPNNILIPAGVKIGARCLLFHEVTIGTGPQPGLPTIGNDVDIYVGARVLGGIVIGDRSMVGANCAVTRDLPAGSVVVQATRVLPRSLARVARAAGEASNGEP